MKNKSFQYSVAIFWLCLITVLLVIPGSKFPKENWLDKLWFDKWVHIGLFAMLVFLWCQASNKKKVFYIIATIAVVYGIGMEFVQQYFVSNRGFELMDIVADAAGSVVGLVYSMMRYRKK
ncbi:MAG: VanZ family protein [Chitinophagaceae bacterium]|nr:VanZ family protein [Chitinophagaceae bacterium]